MVTDAWEATWTGLDSLRADVSRSKSVNVNAQSIRDAAQEVVQQYFRSSRPSLLSAGLTGEDLTAFDGDMQHLLRLAHGRNAKTSYQRTLKALNQERSRIAILREQRLSSLASESFTQGGALSQVEASIIRTLEKMSPTSANSYRQAIEDLQSVRHSYRGTALELRETLREVLDALAPDEAVMKSPGFTLDKDRSGPTMTQKTRFILKSRGLGATSRKAPEQTTTVIEETVSRLARSTYEAGSRATHSGREKEEVQQLKLYVDSILAELLQVHRSGS